MKRITSDDLATIYIISKGRPNCITGKTLERMNYPGPWFIVCGNNDETLDEYIKIWGKERILIFDWYEQIKKTDVLDNFGFEKLPSGAAPVRNAVFDFSRARGEKRHWQMDDDFTSFRLTDTKLKKNEVLQSGDILYYWLHRIAEFGYEANLANVGLELAFQQFPIDALSYNRRIYGTHNMSNDPSITPEWRGRLNDDTIHALTVYRTIGRCEMQIKFLSADTPATQAEKGGLTEFYQQVGTLRKTAYLFLIAPNCTKLKTWIGRFHHDIKWRQIAPRIISEKWSNK